MSETNVEQLERLKTALNLDREPFSDDGVDGLFFPGSGRQELVDQIMHLCRYGSPLLILLGDNGVGKSTIIRQLESRFDPSVFQYVHVEADVLADEQLVLQRIEEQFHVDPGNDLHTAIQSLTRYARELDGFSQTPVIIVDEAQNLSLSAVTFLHQLMAQGAKSGLRCVMCFDGVSVEKIPLLEPVLASDLEFQVLDVPPLDTAGITEYVDYRMTTSGLSDIQFSPEQRRSIQNQSMGNIDRINIIARQILVEHFPYEKNQRKPVRLPLAHASLVSGLALLLGLAFWLLPDIEPGEEDLELGYASVGSAAESGSEKRVTDDSLLFGESPSAKANTEVADQAVHSDTEPRLTNDGAPKKEGAGGVTVVASNTTDEAPEVLRDSEQVRKDLDTFDEGSGVDFNFSDQEGQDDLLQPVAKVAKAENPDKELASVGVARSDPAPVAVKKVEPKPVAQTPALTPREKWLMSLDKGKYTLQMLGASEESSVQKFLARYPSLKDIAYYRTTHRDQDWYVVVYGLFPSKESAKQELTRLPQSLQRSGPWARTIDSVQEEIQQRKPQ